MLRSSGVVLQSSIFGFQSQVFVIWSSGFGQRTSVVLFGLWYSVSLCSLRSRFWSSVFGFGLPYSVFDLRVILQYSALELQSSVLGVWSFVLRPFVFAVKSSVFPARSSVFGIRLSVFFLQHSAFCLLCLPFALRIRSSVFCLRSPAIDLRFSVFGILSSAFGHRLRFRSASSIFFHRSFVLGLASSDFGSSLGS